MPANLFAAIRPHVIPCRLPRQPQRGIAVHGDITSYAHARRLHVRLRAHAMTLGGLRALCVPCARLRSMKFEVIDTEFY